MLSWILCGIWNGDAKILSTLLSKWSLYGTSVDYLHSKVCPGIEPDEVVQSWRGGILLTYDPVRDMQGIVFGGSFIDQLNEESEEEA